MIRSPKALTKAIEVALQGAYRAGWRDATAAMKAATLGKRPKASLKGPSLSAADLKTSLTAREIVIRALEAKPGLEPVEILEWARMQGLPVSFDAVRQEITRLGKKGRVVRSGTGYALRG